MLYLFETKSIKEDFMKKGILILCFIFGGFGSFGTIKKN